MMRIDEEWRMSCDWRRMDMYIWWRNFGTLSGIVYGANGDKEIFCFGFNFIQRDFQIRISYLLDLWLEMNNRNAIKYWTWYFIICS
jgi:hypothetical protein